MGLHDTRYFFEHIIMPGLFYGQPNTLMEILEKDSKSLYELWQSTCKGQHIDDPYKEEDFSVTAFQVSRDVKGFEITLPVPEEAPLCYAFYFVCHKDHKKCAYYTVEKTGQGGVFLCGWTKEGGHINYGDCGLKHETNRNRCGEIFLKAQQAVPWCVLMKNDTKLR